MFSFHMSSRILINQKKIDMALFNFLLRGNTSLDPAKTPKPILWLGEQNWKDIELLTTINQKFTSFTQDIVTSEKLWREWYDCPNPEDAEIPCWYNNLDILSKICILKIFRVDRLKEGISM